MKSSKNIPQQIFITVLIAGIIGIFGMVILKYNIDVLSHNYNEIVNVHLMNRGYMNSASNLMYRHQTITVKHVISTDPDIKAEYEAQADKIEAELAALFRNFDERMKYGTQEQLYHKVYSNYLSYLHEAEVAMEYSRNANTATAEYYVVGTMSTNLNTFNENIDALENYTITEMNTAKDRMARYIKLSQISEILCILTIIVATSFCLCYCVKITTVLDNYKNHLEDEVKHQMLEIKTNSERMTEIQNSTIVGMATLIENRDGDTGEHVKRTSFYVNLLAEAARSSGVYCDELTDKYIELLTKAAPLHDIGKISVPDTILQKPDKLTAEEFEEIKKHTSHGAEIIREVMHNIEEKDYVDIAASVAQYHHEKWDGSGYMEHLSGEDIPLCARIMAIADVFDALISKRCYKQAIPVDEAFKIIEDSSGSHFDPKLVKVWLDMRSDIESYLAEC